MQFRLYALSCSVTVIKENFVFHCLLSESSEDPLLAAFFFYSEFVSVAFIIKLWLSACSHNTQTKYMPNTVLFFFFLTGQTSVCFPSFKYVAEVKENAEVNENT